MCKISEKTGMGGGEISLRQKHYISVDSEYLGRYILDAKVVLWRAESPNVAHSPGQRPGETYAAINTFGIFAYAKMPRASSA